MGESAVNALLDVKAFWIRFEAAKGEGALSATGHVATRGQGGQRGS